MVIGKGGQGIEALKKELLKKMTEKSILINIVEVKNPESDAQLVAENIASTAWKKNFF